VQRVCAVGAVMGRSFFDMGHDFLSCAGIFDTQTPVISLLGEQLLLSGS
jgi:hypothetical protein